MKLKTPPLCRRMKQNAEEGCKKRFRYYDAALQFAQNSGNVCPLCGGALTLSGKYVRKFVNQYTPLRTCEKHGFFVENIGISKMNEKAKKQVARRHKKPIAAAAECTCEGKADE